jgi:hypothetical protein
MLFYVDQSRNVYENKGNIDRMTEIKSDIYGDMTWVLPKNSGYVGPLTLNDSFGAGFARILDGAAALRLHPGGPPRAGNLSQQVPPPASIISPQWQAFAVYPLWFVETQIALPSYNGPPTYEKPKLEIRKWKLGNREP